MTERQIELQSSHMLPNQIRHADNLGILDGQFYKGIYYERGIARLPKKKEVKNERT